MGIAEGKFNHLAKSRAFPDKLYEWESQEDPSNNHHTQLEYPPPNIHETEKTKTKEHNLKCQKF